MRRGKPEEAGVSPSRVALIQERARGWVEAGHHPCLVILAARHGVIFLHEAYGALGPETDSPQVQLDTLFPLTSLTKPFTASVAMTLVEEGLLGLNRPVADYLPEFLSDDKSAILIRHLLTHTSGLRDEDVVELAKSDHPDLDEQILTGWLYENLADWVELCTRVKPHTSPDTVMMYADSNFALLVEVIERTAGKSLDEFSRERVFSKLGMKDTYYSLPDELHSRVVHRPETAPIHYLEEIRKKSPIGTDGLYSTAMDAAIFGQMFLNGGSYGDVKILSSASVRAMTRNQIPGLGALAIGEEFPHAGWGLGWSINMPPSKGALYGEQMLSSSAFAHGGAGGVYLWVDPILDLVGVYFSVVLTEDQRRYKGCCDLFINMVMASVVDLS